MTWLRTLGVTLVIACGGAPAHAPLASHAVATFPSRATCDELVEHLVDLAWDAHATEVAKGHGLFGTWNDGYAEERHEYKKELRAEKGPALSKRCLHVADAHVDCALAAETLDAITTCDASLGFDEQ